MNIKIISWNVNSLRKRIEHIRNLISKHDPDIILIQEAKVSEGDLDQEELKSLGYHFSYSLQKAYNGVVTLSKKDITVIESALPGIIDTQARYKEVITYGIRVANIYVPNGNPVDSDKFTYKMQWLEALYNHIKQFSHSDVPFIIGGDYNIAPYTNDVYDFNKLKNDATCKPEVRDLFFKMISLGYMDLLNLFLTQNSNRFTWWDYRAGSYQSNKGMRIDHFLGNHSANNIVKSVYIDTAPREENQPSDHTTVICELKV